MPTYEYECPRCGRRAERVSRMKDRHEPIYCVPCWDVVEEEHPVAMNLVPSLFSRPLVAEEVVAARKEKAPEIDAYHERTQANFNAETYRRHKAAHRIEGQKDRARQYRWTSKTFIPGGGVMTKYPKGLEKD